MSNIIVGRKLECEQLSEFYCSKEAEFLAIYGRRRVGKTYLIASYFSTKDCLFFHCTGIQKASLKQQITQFTKEMSEVFYSGQTIQAAKNWLDTFENLTKAIQTQTKNQRILLFFDELPWLAGSRSGFLAALEYFWNRYWSNMPNIKLIICGSSASWIIKKIINNKGGLHNRVTRQIILKPFSLSETKNYLESRHIKLNQQQILTIYMAIGGIPHYLKQIKSGLSSDQNINDLCFNSSGILFDEFAKLFSSLFKNEKKYIELIRLIAKSRYGIARTFIEEKVKNSQKGGGLTERLNDLEAAGFIVSYTSIDKSKKGIYYRIHDEYTYFYLTWIESTKRSLLRMETEPSYWLNATKTSRFQAWSGYAFEAVCYKHIYNIKQALRVEPGALSGNWSYQPSDKNDTGAQIDLLFERDDSVITICEIKYSNKPFVIDKKYQQNLLNKTHIYKKITKTQKHILLTLISANGLKQNQYSEIFAKTATLSDLFN